jgi:hypothetical protein
VQGRRATLVRVNPSPAAVSSYSLRVTSCQSRRLPSEP